MSVDEGTKGGTKEGRRESISAFHLAAFEAAFSLRRARLAAQACARPVCMSLFDSPTRVPRPVVCVRPRRCRCPGRVPRGSCTQGQDEALFLLSFPARPPPPEQMATRASSRRCSPCPLGDASAMPASARSHGSRGHTTGAAALLVRCFQSANAPTGHPHLLPSPRTPALDAQHTNTHLVHAHAAVLDGVVGEDDADGLLGLLPLDHDGVPAEERELVHFVIAQRHHGVVVVRRLVHDQAVRVAPTAQAIAGARRGGGGGLRLHVCFFAVGRRRGRRCVRESERRSKDRRGVGEREGSARDGEWALRSIRVWSKSSWCKLVWLGGVGSSPIAHSSIFERTAKATRKIYLGNWF